MFARIVCTSVLTAAAATMAIDASAETGAIDIHSQRLSAAVAELASQAQVEILLNAPGLEGRRTRSVHGSMAAERALRRMTGGLGVRVRRVGMRLFIVQTAQPLSARAQAPAAVSDPDILVTARRRPEKVGEVPALVAHIGPDALGRQGVRTLADLARVTPGFVATGQTSSATPLLVMRGQRRSISDENRLPLVVYQEEVPLPNQAALSPLYDMASIEILRGPQGTLFGRNTTSGAILLRSARPGDHVPSYVETDVGNYGMNRVEGAVDLPAMGAWSLRVAGQRLRRDGFIRMAAGGRADDAHSDAARAVLRFAPDAAVRSLLTFDMLNADERGSAQTLTGVYRGGTARTEDNAPYFDCGLGACDIDALLERQQELGRRTSQSGLSPVFRRRFRGVTNITEYGDGDLLLRNIAGWRSTRIVNALDGDGTPLEINDLSSRTSLRQWTEEFQVQGRLHGTRYIAGVFFLESAPSGTMLQNSAQFVRPGKPPYNIANYQTFRSAALFGQATIPLTPRLKADLGLRYTGEQVQGCSLRSADRAPQSRTDCIDMGGSRNAFRSGRLTWTAALTRQRGDNSLYLTSRRAFRSGGYNNPALGGRLAPFQRFGPESFTDIEAGGKGRWVIGPVQGSYAAAIYAGLYRNIQRALFPDPDFDGDGDPGNDPISFYVNISRARVMGMDGEVAAGIGPRFRATVSFSYVDARYLKVDAPALLASLLGSDPIRNRFSYTPRFSGVVNLVREVPLPDDLGWLELGIDYSHVSTIRFAERARDHLGVQSGYGLLGAAIGWKGVGGRPLDIEIWGRNLTDRYYAAAGGTLNPMYTAATVIPGAPRTLGVRMRYSFQ